MDINRFIDHTILKPEAGLKDIERICNEAIEYNFFAVCVNPCQAKDARGFLKGSIVKLAATVGFPLGANTSKIKLLETQKALSDGSDEIDMVINIGKLKDGELKYVADEIKDLKKACADKILKVIVETCLLTENEKESVCRIVMDSGADFIKTSTGFSSSGAKAKDVKLFKRIAGDKIKIKASGGISDYPTAMMMIEAGASRLGTSRSIAIIEGSEK